MKTLTKFFVLSVAALSLTANAGEQWSGSEALSLITVAPTATTIAPSYAKNVLAAAHEDAVKFVAFQGRGSVSPALREAIAALNEQLVRANIPVENDLKTADLIVFINSIESQK